MEKIEAKVSELIVGNILYQAGFDGARDSTITILG
jgi:hypothetical protein